MALLRKQYAGLKLQINEAKSAVASALGRKFLGYELWVATGLEVKCAVARKAMNSAISLERVQLSMSLPFKQAVLFGRSRSIHGQT